MPPLPDAAPGQPDTVSPTELPLNPAGPTAWEEVGQNRKNLSLVVTLHHLLAQVMPRVPGRILRILVHVGDPVRRGDTLAILDSLEVGDARLTFRQARTRSELAEKEYVRIKQLVDEEVLPTKDLMRATAERDNAMAALFFASGESAYTTGVCMPVTDGGILSGVFLHL